MTTLFGDEFAYLEDAVDIYLGLHKDAKLQEIGRTSVTAEVIQMTSDLSESVVDPPFVSFSAVQCVRTTIDAKRGTLCPQSQPTWNTHDCTNGYWRLKKNFVC